ncbi:unnamed protein product [Tilletia controversa]|nr:unnamed protein product [Tilletia controversa]
MLAASGSGDERWTTAERSAFLSRLCDPNRGGMDRVKEILLKPTVTKSTFSQHLLYQNGMILVFMFLTSSTVLKTAVATSTNLLYGIIDSYLDVVLNASKEGVRQLIESRGHNLQGSDTTSMVQVFKPLILLVNEYLNRFPAAALSRFDALHAFLSEVSSRLDEWVRAFTVGTFQDQLSCVGTDKERWVNFIKASLQQKITKMQQTLEFAKSSVTIRSAPAERPATHRPIPVGEGQLQMLIRDFDPPGGLRESGPRHDNDHALIRDVGVHPTSQEIACRQPPYIPYNFIGAPHHLASGSPEQQLDIHFRLLREELVEPLRGSLSALSHELESLSQGGNQLDRLLKKGGGRFKAGVAFESQQSQKAWDYQLERLLNPGALVAVMSSAEEDDQVETFLGLVRSPPAEIKASVRNHRPTVKIEFFEKRAIHFALSTTKCAGTQLLAEVRGVMYESVAPFLRNLKETTSAQLPFAELLALPTSVPTSPMTVQPPRYARNPTFSYNLSGLLRKESARASEGLHMTLNEDSQERARVVLKEHGTLDGTQADAVIDTLSREVGIIQGPPGTGKSYTGVALINTLLKSKIDPILVVCMTNHALDSVLSKVLDQGLTKNIVRLGSRSKDERISSYNLEALVATRQKTEDDRGARREWCNLKLAQEEMLKGVKQLKGGSVDNTQLFDLATSTSPDHVFSMLDFSPSLWPAISEWVASNRRQGSNKRTTRLDDIDIFDFWRCGVDLDMLQRPAATATASKGKDVLRDATAATNRYEVLAERSDSGSDAEEPWPCDMDDEDDDVEEREGREHASAAEAAIVEVEEETDEESLQDELTAPRPSWPDIKHRGSLELLLDDPNVWSYSRADRALLVDQWTAIFRQAALSSLDDIYDKVQTARAGVQEHRDQERLSVLRHCKIIGATTNGAAKAAELLKKVKPRVLLVEEAGQVLEAHILAILSSSVEHLILIGDHKQLRPQVTNYGLSMDNKRGRGHLHRLDFSMMEHLAEESKLPVSRITTQRRMRPEICDLIRPVQELDDHDSVKHRGDIKGVATNCFFFSHDHAESAQETSRTNEFEADMAVDFVRHLVHQGYTGANDICIIVAYLSQIAKVKERLFSHQINIVLSEKDADALAEAEARDADADYHPEAVIVTQSLGTSVRVATVDNFQGEEAKIIILSLVRNQGVDSDEQLASSRFLRKSGIGFLKSPNRSYVALSRARDGLFVFGNAGLLHDHSPFWAQILEKMEAKGGIVGGIPIICSRHPEKGIREVSEVGQLRLLSPNGGCEEVCGDVRRCGHVCKAKCHPGDSAHTLLPCLDNCTRLLDCQHPCKKRCGDKCGPCDFIVPVVGLPCGHSAVEVRCAQVESGQVWCAEPVIKTLAKCGHQITTACSMDASTIACTETCLETLPCCGRICQSGCQQCTNLNVTKRRLDASSEEDECDSDEVASAGKAPSLIRRTRHSPHVCGQKRRCGHACKEARAKCASQTANGHASTDVAPVPTHVECHVSEYLATSLATMSWAADILARATCATCATEEKRSQTVDLLMLTNLADTDTSSRDLSERTITLACGHVFTVETLDGHFQMSTFYNKGPNEDWQSSSSIPTDFFSAFVCPFCKKPASAMRYGRPKKRAFLDEQERKHIDAAERHCKFLAERTAQLDVDQLAQVFKSPQSKRQIQGPVQHTLTLKGQKKLLHQLARSSDPTPADFWDNLLQFGFSQSTAVAWAESVQPILAVNRGADRMLKEKSPHVQAWQAAVSQAHQRILATLDPCDVRRDQKALQLARASVSIPEPRAQSKYHLISIFIALDCRMLLATLGKTVDGAIQSKEDEKWPNFVDLILSSGSQDAQKAFKRAEESLHGKDALRAQAYDTRFRAELLMNKLGKSIAKAQGDALSLVELEQRAERDLGKLCRHWRQVVRATTADANFKDQIDSVVSQRLADVEHFVKLGQRRKEELKMIVSAMFTSNVDMRYGGHFYRCGNGHSFVIGNCGGAMEVSRCPECGVAIGGSDHTLAAGNTSDTEMEQIAREFGARPSPWPWARA